MPAVKQENSPIDVLAEIRQNWRSKQETEETASARKRTRNDHSESEDEVETIISRRVKRQRSPLRRASQVLRESRTSSVVSTQASHDQSQRSSAATTPITAHHTSSALSQRPKIRLTENGATLFLCQHPGCEKPCRTLKLLQSHVETVHAPTVGNADVPHTISNTDVPPTLSGTDGYTVDSTRKALKSTVIDTSSGLVPTDEPKPRNQLRSSVDEDDNTLRARAQPSRWRQRQNHPLFISPDPASASKWTRVVPGSEKQSSADGNNTIDIAPQKIQSSKVPDDTESAAATAVGLHVNEHAHSDSSSASSPTPLECPVIVCRKTFKFKRDIQYHWTNDHKGQRLISSGNGSFHLLNPETNQPSSDPETKSFVCEDCGSYFKGVHGLDFHKSRSLNCRTPSTTLPELLMHAASTKIADRHQADTPFALPPARSAVPEKTAIAGQALDKDQIKPEKHFNKINGCKPARLTINTQNMLPANSNAEDMKSKCPFGPSTEYLGLAGDSSDEEQPNANQEASIKCPKRRPRITLPPDPDSWAEAMDADRRLVVQGQRNVKWRMIQEAWIKSTGLRIGIPTLQYRQARLVSIIGNEAMRHSHTYIDSGEESAGSVENTRLRKSNVRAVRRRLAFPLSWDQADKADRKLVSMKEKGHKWSTIVEEFQTSIGRHMSPETCKSRYHRLVALREKALPSPPASAVTPSADDTRVKTEERSPNQGKDKNNDDKAGDLSDGVSVYSISDDSSEDEGPLSVLRIRCHNQQSNAPRDVDKLVESRATSFQSVRQDVPMAEVDSAVDPDQMLAAMQNGKNRWPKIREAWEKATKRKTPTNHVAKQDLGLLNDDDINLLLAAEAVVEARFAHSKYAMIADMMRANGAEDHKAKFVETELERVCKSPKVPENSCDTRQEVSPPDSANIELKSEDFQKKLLESCAQQMSVIAEAKRLEMEKTFEALRQQARKSENEVTKTVNETAPRMDDTVCRDEKDTEILIKQPPSGPAVSKYAQHQTRDKVFSCRVCPANFASHEKLQEHLRALNHHERNRSNPSSPGFQTRGGDGALDRATQRDDSNYYVCRVCIAGFPTNGKLQAHLSSTGHRHQKKVLPVASR